jgi:uncharacterized membrane protein
MYGPTFNWLVEAIGCLLMLLLIAVVCLGGVALGWFGWAAAGKIAAGVFALAGAFILGHALGDLGL